MTRHPHRLNRVFLAECAKLAAGDNVQAYAYLMRCFDCAEKIDDLTDKDISVTADGLEQLFSALLTGFDNNEFYMRNFQALTALQIVSYNAWIDSNIIKRDSVNADRVMFASILADWLSELYCYVAFVTGGFGRMREVSRMVREDQFTTVLGE